MMRRCARRCRHRRGRARSHSGRARRRRAAWPASWCPPPSDRGRARRSRHSGSCRSPAGRARRTARSRPGCSRWHRARRRRCRHRRDDAGPHGHGLDDQADYRRRRRRAAPLAGRTGDRSWPGGCSLCRRAPHRRGDGVHRFSSFGVGYIRISTRARIQARTHAPTQSALHRQTGAATICGARGVARSARLRAARRCPRTSIPAARRARKL